MTQVLDFLWGSIQYKDFAFLGLIQRDLWGPLRPGKISGHGLSQYSFQGTIYAKSAMTQVLVILGGFSENRFFGTYQILWMSDLGVKTAMTQVLDLTRGFVPYGLLGPNGDTKLSQCSLQGTIYVKCDDASLSYYRRIFWKSLFRHLPDSLDVRFGGSYPRPLRPAGTQWGHQTVDMTNTSDICQNCDDASPRFCFETKLYIRLWFLL